LDLKASQTLSRRASSSPSPVSDLVPVLCSSLLPEGTTPTSHANWRLRSRGPKPSHGWLVATFYPCPAGTAPGTPETVFARKRSLEAWTEPTHLTRGSVTSQVQQRSARTSPRCDVAVVPPVYLDVWCTFPDARSGCCGWAFSSGDRDRGRSPAVGDRAGLPVHLDLPTHEPGSGGDLAPVEVTPQGDE